MSTGHKITLGKSVKIKDGKIVTVQHFRDASHKIRALKSKRVRVSRRTTP